MVPHRVDKMKIAEEIEPNDVANGTVSDVTTTKMSFKKSAICGNDNS